jgi:hypothetical protein
LYVVLKKNKIRHINITQQTECTLNNEINEHMVFLEKIRKKYQIWTNNDEEILVTTFDFRLKGEIGTVLHLNKTGPHSHLNRTKEEAEGTAARHRRRRARFGGFDTQEGIPGLVGGK